MLLRTFSAGIPIGIFFCISALFWFVQFRVFDLIGSHYNFCHMLFGFAFPLLLGYFAIPPKQVERVKFRVFLDRVLKTPVGAWPLAIARSVVRDFRAGIPWSPLAGVVVTLFFSLGNEVIIDPMTNGIPFTSAYEHFVADVIGMALFLLVTHPLARRNSSRAVLRMN